jgi:hypothetical protein
MATIPSNQKILTSAPEVNTTYGGPASLQALNTWYTMEDIANTVRPYKVYTALLTQTGGDDVLQINSGELTIGVTYFLDEIILGDFTNVGAPNNNSGTYFVATGTTPTAWGDSTLTYNTGAPVVTVLENTIGDIYFEYTDVGTYTIRSMALFTDEKTVMYLGPFRTAEAPLTSGVEYDSSRIVIRVAEDSVLIDDILRNTPIEIRVYN